MYIYIFTIYTINLGFGFVPTIDDDLTATVTCELGSSSARWIDVEALGAVNRMDSNGFPWPFLCPAAQSSGQLLLPQRGEGKVATEVLSPEALD